MMMWWMFSKRKDRTGDYKGSGEESFQEYEEWCHEGALCFIITWSVSHLRYRK